MDRFQKILVLLLVAAIPAGAPSSFTQPVVACFTSGSVTYRITRDVAAPDYRVRIDNNAANPYLRLRLADRAENADFVLVDDVPSGPGSPCHPAGVMKTIKIVSNEPADFIISLTDMGDAGHALYVYSNRFSHADSAALFAVLRHADTPHLAAARESQR
jgi:hypothetical protein